MEERLDKTVIYIDNINSRSVSNNCQYVCDLVESLKDVVYIKVMKTEVLAKHSEFSDGDPVFVKINDYKRMSAVIDGNSTKFFETVSINKSDKSATALGNEIVSFKKDSTTSFHVYDPNLYVFKPLESHIKTLNVELYDKHNNLLNKSQISGFNMIMCIYSLNKKISQETFE